MSSIELLRVLLATASSASSAKPAMKLRVSALMLFLTSLFAFEHSSFDLAFFVLGLLLLTETVLSFLSCVEILLKFVPFAGSLLYLGLPQMLVSVLFLNHCHMSSMFASSSCRS